MEFSEAPLGGAYVVRMKRIEDDRGFFARGWCRDEFLAHGLNPNIVQLNVAVSPKKGTLRGLHFQRAPHGEAKFVRCTRGGIFDVMVDLREESPTRSQWFGLELTADNGTMLYVPEGFAHGYQTLTDDAEMYYLTTAPYAAASAGGVRYNDPVLGIEWPLPVSLISKADEQWPDFVA